MARLWQAKTARDARQHASGMNATASRLLLASGTRGGKRESQGGRPAETASLGCAITLFVSIGLVTPRRFLPTSHDQ